MRAVWGTEVNRGTGRQMSVRYHEVVSRLAHTGLKPGEYVRQARALGCSYRVIGEMIAAETGKPPPYTDTLNYWERVE